MSKFHSHIQSAKRVLEKYDGSLPLSQFLKRFFSTEKKYGSKDRKEIAALCYAYFRMGLALPGVSTEEKILTGIFLSEDAANELLHQLKPDLNSRIGLIVQSKLLQAGINEAQLFPYMEELSPEINAPVYARSFLKQPRLFLRTRPGKYRVVVQKLKDAGISFDTDGEECIMLMNAVKAGEIISINKEAVIQDKNSQRVLDHLSMIKFAVPKAWDCCAASGGKSILLYDRLKGEVRLTVSDIREQILVNLKKRLAEAGIPVNKSFVSDLQNEAASEQEMFNIIVCDAPCTGSGTWSRTPEQLYYFKKGKISEYAILQRNIIANTVPALAKGGLYFYITCSVFKRENEAQAEYLEKEMQLKLLSKEYLNGYNSYADTMFVAVFTK